MGRRLVVIAVVLACARAAGAETRSIGLLPIQSKWTSTAELVRITDVLGELGGELGLEIRALDTDTSSCFGVQTCYIEAAQRSGAPSVLALEVVKTSSGRFHFQFRVIDTARGTVQALPLVRSAPGVLRAVLRPTVVAIREAVPDPSARVPFPPVTPLPPLPPAPPATEPEVPVPPWYQSISVNAFVSAAYTYNLNRPKVAVNTLRVFDVEHNSATIDVAELVVQRAATEPGSAGFRIDLVAGSAIPHVEAAAGLFRDADGNAEDFDLQQAYASYDADLGRGLRIDAGKFTSPAGAEVIEGYDGFGDHYSRSLLFGFAVPFTHTGARVAYSFSDRLTVTLFAFNGWDVVRDNNRGKSGGIQVAILPAAELSIAATYLGGPEQPDDNRTLRHLGDLVVTYKPAQRVALTANADAGQDGDARWYGVAGYLRLDLAKRLAIATRGELFEDPDGVRTGTAQRLWEATLTTSLGLSRGLTFRIELRYDHSDQRVFPQRDDLRRFQLTTAVNAVYAL